MIRCLPQCLQPRQNFTQQACRYGIGLSAIGVVLNWLGVADSAIEHVRYLGVFLVIVGSFLIVASMGHWMIAGSQAPTQNSSRDPIEDDSHRVNVDGNQSADNLSNDRDGSPPDYYLVADKPPTYEQAMSSWVPRLPLSATSFTLQSDSSLPPYSSRFDILAGYDRETGEIIEMKSLDDTAHFQPASGQNQEVEPDESVAVDAENEMSNVTTNELLLQPNSLCSVHSYEQHPTSQPSSPSIVQRSENSLPNFSISIPESSESIQQSPGSIQQSSDSIQQSSGSIQQSSGSIQQSSGSIQQSSGSIQQSSGSIQQSSGSIQQSSGSIQQSSGSIQQSSGSTQQSSE